MNIVLPDMIPELRRYLLEYPNASLANADSFFYWEKVDFGLKPTTRVNHTVIYRGRTQGHDFGAVANKQMSTETGGVTRSVDVISRTARPLLFEVSLSAVGIRDGPHLRQSK